MKPPPGRTAAPTADDAEPVASRRDTYLRLASFVLLTALFCGVSLLTPVRGWFTVERVSDLAARAGVWGPVVIGVAALVTPFLFLPRWPIALVCGLLYGIGWGSLLANVASTAGAVAHYAFARTLLAPSSERLLRRYGMDRLDVPSDKAFVVLIFLRAFPLSNFVATNLLAGALRVRARTYVVASFLGMIPSTLLYAAWGKMLKQQTKGFYALAGVTLVVLVAGTLAAQRWFLPWLRHFRSGNALANDDRMCKTAGGFSGAGGRASGMKTEQREDRT